MEAGGGGGGTNLSGAPYNVPASQLDFYYIAQATTDLDDNGVAMIIESTSFSRDLWYSTDKEWE